VRHRRYPAYKESGVEWLGEVPEGWSAKRGRWLLKVNPPSQRLRSLAPDAEVSFVPMDAVGELGGLRLDATCPVGESSGGYTEFENDDVVVAKITPCFENGKGALVQGLLSGAAFGTTELLVLRTGHRMESRFLFAMTVSDVFRKLGEGEMYGAGGQKRVPPAFCKDFRFPLPPIDDQLAIADFLDAATARLDALLDKNRFLIETLKERRTALISRTVTRGLPPEAARAACLDPHPRLNPSGIEWIGEVPEHWSVKPLKRAVRFVEGPGILAVDFVDEGVPLLRISSIGTRFASLDGCNHLSEERVRQSWSHFRVRLGDLLISGSASTGFCSEVEQATEGAIPYTGIIIMRPRRFEAERDFVRWMFLSDEFLTQASLAKTGSTIQHFGPTHLSRMTVALPPLPEQRAIAAYLDRETARIDALVAKVEEAIARLQEYRAALITAAVTGRIDVRAAVGARVPSVATDELPETPCEVPA
jgi:type I restriction enzyme S subunit